MTHILQRRLAAAGVAVVVAFAGAGTAAACDRDGGHRVLGAKHAFAKHHGWRHHGLLRLASDYLGIDKDALKAQLRSGKTLAQVASATPNKSAAGLVDYVVAKAKTRLDRLVAAGKLTQAQENALLAKLREKVTAVVNATRHHG